MKLSGYQIQAGAFIEFKRFHIKNQSCSISLKKSMDQPKPKIFSPGDITFRARKENPDVFIHDLVHMNSPFVDCDLLKKL